MKKNYSFIEYVAAWEGEDFDTLDQIWVDHWAKYIPKTLTETPEGVIDHSGSLEWIQSELAEYYLYVKDYDTWVDEVAKGNI